MSRREITEMMDYLYEMSQEKLEAMTNGVSTRHLDQKIPNTANVDDVEIPFDEYVNSFVGGVV